MQRIVLSTVLVLAAAVAAPAEDVTVGMSGSYYPFTYVEQDTLKGFEVDVVRALAAEAGDEVRFETMAFSGLVGALRAERIDTIANQITITPEREAAFVFTEPYVYDGAQVVVRRGDDEIAGVEDLKGRTVAVDLGSNFEALLRELPYADEIDIRTYEGNVVQETVLGRVDAFVMDRVSASQLIAEKDLPLRLAGEPFTTIRNALPFRDTEEGRTMRDRYDAAIAALREDGTLAAISREWFGTVVTSR